MADTFDVCPRAYVPKSLISASGSVSVNRYGLLDSDTCFDRNGAKTDIEINETGGSSAEQIADQFQPVDRHYRFGISGGVLKQWIEQIQAN